MRVPKLMIAGARKVADNPYINLVAAGVLIVTAVSEMLESPENLTELGVHHGVLLFGIAHLLTAVPELLHGLDELLKADQEVSEAAGSDGE